MGWFHRPVTIQGWVADLLVLAFCVTVFIAVDRNSHSFSDTLYGIFPFVVPSLLALEWLIRKTS